MNYDEDNNSDVLHNDDDDDHDDADDADDDDDDDNYDDDDSGDAAVADDGDVGYDESNDEESERSMNNAGDIVSDSYGKLWNQMYDRLLKYKNKYKSTAVPRIFDDGRLGRWISKQRYFYSTNKLSQYRIHQLNSINFVWTIQIQWKEMYERLMAYKNKYKSTNVSTTFEDDARLGRWVQTQRIFYINNKLSQDRINQLNSISFVWNVYDAYWEKMYGRLLAYKNKYESTCVPQSYAADPQLGTWVHTQRRHFSNNNPSLTTYRINRLNSIDFVWNANKNKNNCNRMEETTIFDDNIEIPTYDHDHWTTGNWCWEVRPNSTTISGTVS